MISFVNEKRRGSKKEWKRLREAVPNTDGSTARYGKFSGEEFMPGPRNIVHLSGVLITHFDPRQNSVVVEDGKVYIVPVGQ